MVYIRQPRPDYGFGFQLKVRETFDRLRVGWLNGSGTGAGRAEDAHGTPTQRYIPRSILVYEYLVVRDDDWGDGATGSFRFQVR